MFIQARFSNLLLVLTPLFSHGLLAQQVNSSASPAASGSGGWEAAFQKAVAFTQQLNLTEKTTVITGSLGIECDGQILGIERMNFSGLCLHDGPVAIRTEVLATVFPAGVTAGSTWDKGLIYARGYALGQEFKGKGAHVILGPVAGPIGRHPLGGRNWEGFGTDPYLSGVAMQETVSGIQNAGVQACAKHYVGNEQETMRMPTEVNGSEIPSISSNIDDRTLHELYTWPFANAVKAGVSSVMCSYNRLNGTYACENSRTLNEILKTELGFQGYVMSDWFATHTGVKAINSGLDMNMPGPLDEAVLEGGVTDLASLPSWFGSNITTSLQNGSLIEQRLDDMIHRIMTPYFFLKQDEDYPSPDPSSEYVSAVVTGLGADYALADSPSPRDVRSDHAGLVRTIGSAGIVLLKNTGSALPLTNETIIGVFGNDAVDVTKGLYLSGENGVPYDTPAGTLAMGGGSGSGFASYVVSPLTALMQKAATVGAQISYITDNDLVAANALYSIFPIPQVCLVFLKTWAEESEDRTSFLNDWNSTLVVNNVAAICPNTIVITHSSGVNTMPWADNENVTAILAAGYPGQESGNSLVDVLYGDVNPSGHLIYTIPKQASDYNFPIFNTTDSVDPEDNFTEGLLIDYRHFDAYNITPLYEFGHGLSYTTFNFTDDMDVEVLEPNATASAPPAEIVPGGSPSLWNTIIVVSANVTNTGLVTGAVVPQLYISFQGAEVPANTPLQVLRGFDKIELKPGQTSAFTMDLARRDLSYWDVEEQEWIIPIGPITISLGFSSRDLRLTKQVVVVQ